jgi:hypothetical protein
MYREEFVPAGSNSGFTDEYASVPPPWVSDTAAAPSPASAPEATDV